MKRFFAVLVATVFMATFSPAGEKVKLCHNDEEKGFDHVIEVSANSVDKHLAHGDNVDAATGLEAGDACVIPAL
ncbi:MAG: hypothetical protein ACRD96_09075 [Bryobacteraceae bacterium]